MKRLKKAGLDAGTGVRPIGPGGEGRSGAAVHRGDGRALAILALVLATMLLILALPRLAGATAVDEFDLTIPIDTVVFAAEGTTSVLATAPVGDEFLGQVCTVAAEAKNQSSVHPNNDLIVASGGSVVTLEDVEGTAGGVVTANGQLTLGSEIVVSLLMGPDGVFSAGFKVHVECVAAVSTSTTVATTTTTTEAPTTTNGQVAPTSVTAPPPEGPATTVVDDSVLGTVITSSTVAEEVEDVEALPFTGSQDGALLLLAGSLLALGGVLVVASRREEG